jgi:hypothetical protein
MKRSLLVAVLIVHGALVSCTADTYFEPATPPIQLPPRKEPGRLPTDQEPERSPSAPAPVKSCEGRKVNATMPRKDQDFINRRIAERRRQREIARLSTSCDEDTLVLDSFEA